MLLSGKELSADLSPRARAILHSIVNAYIDTGEPIGSRTISRMRSLALSRRPIRNVMADLAMRVIWLNRTRQPEEFPPVRHFRDFAGNVPSRPLPVADCDHIFKEMQSGESLEERVGIASRVLTEITRNVGIAAALPSSSQELEHLELIALSERRVLMIVATKDRMVRNKVVTLDRAMTQDDLIQLRNYVNANFRRVDARKSPRGTAAPDRRRTRHVRCGAAAIDAALSEGLVVADQDPQLPWTGRRIWWGSIFT